MRLKNLVVHTQRALYFHFEWLVYSSGRVREPHHSICAQTGEEKKLWRGIIRGNIE